MRFYKRKQAEMLHAVSVFLQANDEKLIEKVPALREFITEFAKMEKEIYDVSIGIHQNVRVNTLNKQVVREAFVKIVFKLISVLKASGYKFKNKPLDEMQLTRHDLKKMPSEKLGRAYLKVYAAAKKIRHVEYYGLAPEMMQDSQAYYKEFSAVKNAPTIRKKEVAKINEATDEAMKDAILYIKNHIDPLMHIAVEDDLQLRINYAAVRQVLPRAAGRPSDVEVAYRKSREKK